MLPQLSSDVGEGRGNVRRASNPPSDPFVTVKLPPCKAAIFWQSMRPTPEPCPDRDDESFCEGGT